MSPMSLELTDSFPYESNDGILAPPSNGIDLKKLANDTQDALEALEPFYNKGNKWYRPKRFSKTKSIALNVRSYANAIESSIRASGHGHAIATDAIDALDYILGIPAERFDPQDTVLINYLQTTSELAVKGLALAEGARDAFQDVRKSLNMLMGGSESTNGHNTKNTADATAAALEKFRDTLSQYVNWWIEMGMRHNTQRTRNVEYNAIRQQGIRKIWLALQSDYIIYNQRIAEVRDSYGYILDSK